jgi:hypothetical protein
MHYRELNRNIGRHLTIGEWFMDLLMTEHLERERWSKAKLGALACFAVACALLVASLLTPQSAQVGMDGRLTAGAINSR